MYYAVRATKNTQNFLVIHRRQHPLFHASVCSYCKLYSNSDLFGCHILYLMYDESHFLQISKKYINRWDIDSIKTNAHTMHHS